MCLFLLTLLAACLEYSTSTVPVGTCGLRYWRAELDGALIQSFQLGCASSSTVIQYSTVQYSTAPVYGKGMEYYTVLHARQRYHERDWIRYIYQYRDSSPRTGEGAEPQKHMHSGYQKRKGGTGVGIALYSALLHTASAINLVQYK
ncbi:hypothetical protein HOY80DRAFT_949514 [Tuber brumale]|nr:hypothetical protein HOY80DRAFT_949514 [Tuber brumale]